MTTKLNCPRCGELNIVYGVDFKKGVLLTFKEKQFIFSKWPYLCIPCIMQLKSRYKISIDHNPYKKKTDIENFVAEQSKHFDSVYP